jgi:hypothetical protein
LSVTTNTKSPLRVARDDLGLAREAVTRRPELDPPITAKTLERWENGTTPVRRWRLKQLAAIYGVSIKSLAAAGRDGV